MPPKKTKTKKSEPCEDWEDEDYDINPSPVSPFAINPQAPEQPSLEHQGPPLESPSASPDPVEIQNSILWNNANRKPQYVIMPSNAAHSAVSAQRPLAQNVMFGQSAMTILKRPPKDPSTQADSMSRSASSAADISAREKAYLEARERIFGSSSASPDRPATRTPLGTEPIENRVAIERQPTGPTALNQKGFGTRQKSLTTIQALDVCSS